MYIKARSSCSVLGRTARGAVRESETVLYEEEEVVLYGN